MFSKNLGLIICVSLNCTIGFAAKAPTIKVLIGSNQKSISVIGRNITRKIIPRNTVKYYKGSKKINFNCRTKSRLQKRGVKPVRLAQISSTEKLLTFNKKRYSGAIHVQTSEGMKGCDIVNELPLEIYLSSLLSKEMNAKWPIEALKAQAVAARSYAFLKIKNKDVSRKKGFEAYYDVENSEWHQVSGSFLDATKKTVNASFDTYGEVLTYKGKDLTPVFFHSKCGGKTLLPEQVWSNKVRGYKSVDCPYCHKHGLKKWKKKITNKNFANALYRSLQKYQKENRKEKATNPLRLLRDKKRYTAVRFYKDDNFKKIKKSRLRSILGRETLPSNYYQINKQGKSIEFSGTGYGHGVGMCQFGALELAQQGYNYKQILAHYFPKLTLKKVY